MQRNVYVAQRSPLLTLLQHWFQNIRRTSLNPVLNAQVCVYLMVHYICAKKVYYAVTTKCRKQHAIVYRTTLNAFPYFWSNKS